MLDLNGQAPAAPAPSMPPANTVFYQLMTPAPLISKTGELELRIVAQAASLPEIGGLVQKMGLVGKKHVVVACLVVLSEPGA